MDDQDWLAERFEGHRSHLRAVAYRMLGSPSEADDALQEAWFRLNRSDAGDPRRLMLCAVGTRLGFAGRRV
jgi:DNA-directed RNA polymerase specialized sigma24 family protein